MSEGLSPEEQRLFNGIQQGMHFGSVSPYEDEGPEAKILVPGKAGMTKRGKIAIGAASVALIGSGFVFWSTASADAAKDAKETAAIELEMQRLKLEEMRIQNESRAKANERASTAQAALRKDIDRCISEGMEKDSGILGTNEQWVAQDCKNRYGDVASDIKNVSAEVTPEDGSGGTEGMSAGTLVGLVAIGAAGAGYVAWKGKRSQSA